MSTTRTVAVGAVDADGCAYSKIFIANLYRAARLFGDQFIALAKKDVLTSMDYLLLAIDSKAMRKLHRSNLLAENEHDAESATLTAAYVAKFVAAWRKLDPKSYRHFFACANKPLFDKLKDIMQDADEGIVAIGSNRQTKWHDDAGLERYGTGPYFLDISVIHEIWQVLVPTKPISLFLGTLGDIYGFLPHGANVGAILTGESGFEDIYEDEMKTSLHYYLIHALMARCEKKYPDVSLKLHYHFFDNLDDLHREGYNFYNQFHMALPAGVFFHNELYDGKHRSLYSPIAGTGTTDFGLRLSFRFIPQIFGFKNADGELDLSVYLDPAKMPVFLRERSKRQHSFLLSSKISFAFSSYFHNEVTCKRLQAASDDSVDKDPVESVDVNAAKKLKL